MEGNMKGIGLKIKGKVEGMKYIKTETNTPVITSMVKLMEKVYIHGTMEKYMMVNGKKD
jgi:hypothetical protein